jgi:HEAT repeat protein
MLIAAMSPAALGQDWAVRELRVKGHTLKSRAADLKSKDAETRLQAVQALAEFAEHSRAATPYLLAAARDPDPSVRAAAMSAQLPKSDEVEKLIAELVQDPDVEVRYSAHRAAIRLADNGLPSTLSAALYEDDASVRQLALDALSRHYVGRRSRARNVQLTPFVPAMVYAYTRCNDESMHWLAHFLTSNSADSLPLLRKCAWSSHAKIRRRAWNILPSVTAGNDLQVALRLALNDQDAEVRTIALNRVAAIARWDDCVFPAILDGISDPDRTVREAALRSLSNVQPTYGIDVARVFDLTRRPNEAIRTAAASALGNFAATDDEARSTLLQLLKDPSSDVRQASCLALERLESANSSTFRALLTALDDEDDTVRQVARRAIANFDPTGFDQKLVEETLEAFIRLLVTDQFSEASAIASWRLHRFDPDGKRLVPHYANWILLNPDNVNSNQMAVLKSYGRRGEEAVVRFARSPIDQIANAAIQTLNLAEPKNRDLLLAALKSEGIDRRIAALASMSNRPRELDASVANELAKCLLDDDSNVRAAAVRALDRCPPTPTMIRPLAAVLVHPDSELRRPAMVALQRLPKLPADILDRLATIARLDHDDAMTAIDLIAASDPRSTVGIDAALSRIANGRNDRYLLVNLHRLRNFEVRRGETAIAVADRLQRETENPSDETFVPSALIGALGELGPAADNSMPILMHYACDGRKDLRLAAVTALGQIGPNAAAAVPLLYARLEDEEPEVAEAACVALGKIVAP